MFEFTISKQQLLTPLLTVASAVDKKQSLPILSNILLRLNEGQLQLTATDLEIEVTCALKPDTSQHTGAVTVPAKKMVDIIRSLEDNANPVISFDEKGAIIKEGRSRFKLATLDAAHYPGTDEDPSEVEISLPKSAFVELLQATHFAMSQQDVRVYLNGLLLELDAQSVSCVATDGHRMAIYRLPLATESTHHRILLPRKAVQEILRLLNHVPDETISLSAGKNLFKLVTEQYTFISKRIEARFPPYHKAIPKNQDKQIVIERDVLRRALSRIVILAHEKSRAVLLHLQPGQLTLIANNQEQEEAVEVLEAETQGDELKIGMNAGYLLDVLSYLQDDKLRISLSDMDSSILIEPLQSSHYQYIIMPMKI